MKYSLFLILLICIFCSSGYQYWVDQAIGYQYEIQRDLPLNEVIMLGSHNAYDRPNEDYTGDPLKAPHPSSLYQNTSLTQQLNLGARILDFDIHWINEQIYNCDGNYVIYLVCYQTNDEAATICNLVGIQNYTQDTGCYVNYDKTIDVNLKEIYDWLHQPDNREFIILSMEWLISKDFGDDEALILSTLESIIRSLFDTEVYTSVEHTGVWPSLNELYNTGKRILCTGIPPTLNSDLCFNDIASEPWFITNRFINDFDPSSCRQIKRGASVPVDDFFSFIEDEIYEKNPIGVYNETIARAALDCGIGVTFDRLDFEKNKWIVWSWAEGEPALDVPSDPVLGSDGCAYFDGTTKRWYAVRCDSETYPFACYDSSSSTWQISSITDNGNNWKSACTSPYIYSFPTKPIQNLALSSEAGNNRVWIHVANAPAALPNYVPLPPIIPPVTPPGSIVPPEDNRLLPVEPRFCGLYANATTYDCHPNDYVKSVVNRNIAAIVFMGIMFVISFIFGCVLLCFFCGFCLSKPKVHTVALDDNDSSDEQSEYVLLGKHCCDHREHYFVILSIILILAGTICLFIGNAQFEVVHMDGTDLLRSKLETIIPAIKVANESLFGLLDKAKEYFGEDNPIDTDTIDEIQLLLAEGSNELKVNVNDFTLAFDEVNNGRRIYIIIVAILPIILLILAFVLLRLHYNRLLIVLLLLLNFFVFLCILTYILHSVASTLGKDICAELNYKNGLFDLFQEKAKNGINLMTGVLDSTINETVDTGCDFFTNEVCDSYDVKIWLCEMPCNYALFQTIYNETVIDSDGTEKTLRECSESCIDDSLRAGSDRIGGVLELIPLTENLRGAVLSIYNGILSEETRASLIELLCDKFLYALYITYVGAGLMLVGILSGIIMIAYFRWKKSNRY